MKWYSNQTVASGRMAGHSCSPCWIAISLCAVVLLSLSTIGCDLGNRGGAAPTTKSVTPGDVVGVWEAKLEEPRGVSMRVTIRSDGTFHQEVWLRGSANAVTRDGTWRLDKYQPIVVFNSMLIYFNGWVDDKDRIMSWDVVDSANHPGTLALEGGVIPDPDCFVEFERKQ